MYSLEVIRHLEQICVIISHPVILIYFVCGHCSFDIQPVSCMIWGRSQGTNLFFSQRSVSTDLWIKMQTYTHFTHKPVDLEVKSSERLPDVPYRGQGMQLDYV